MDGMELSPSRRGPAMPTFRSLAPGRRHQSCRLLLKDRALQISGSAREAARTREVNTNVRGQRARTHNLRERTLPTKPSGHVGCCVGVLLHYPSLGAMACAMLCVTLGRCRAWHRALPCLVLLRHARLHITSRQARTAGRSAKIGPTGI